MWLDCGPHGKLQLSRITPNAVVVKEPVNVPPCHGNLIVSVDGEEMVVPVHVVEGISQTQHHTMALKLDHVAPF